MKITKIIHQTYSDRNQLAPEIIKNIDYLKDNNKDWEYRFYDDQDILDYVALHFGDKVLSRIKKINKKYSVVIADLFRYLVVYNEGGVYLDIKFKCEDNFKLIELTDKEYFVLDRPYARYNINIEDDLTIVNDKNYYKHVFKNIDTNFWKNKEIGLYNALMVCKPNNPILLECINSIVENVKQKNYDYNHLYVTGPGLLGEKYFKGDFSKVNSINLFNSLSGNYILNRNKKILSHYPEYRIEQKKYQKNEYYYILWKNKKIYKETEM